MTGEMCYEKRDSKCWRFSSAFDLEENMYRNILKKDDKKHMLAQIVPLGYRKANFYQFSMAKKTENARKYLVRR